MALDIFIFAIPMPLMVKLNFDRSKNIGALGVYATAIL